MRAIRHRVMGCRHGRLFSRKREYPPGFVPRHAKPEPVESPLSAMGLAA